MTAPDADPTDPGLDLETLLAMTRDSASIVWDGEDDEERGDPAGCGGAGGGM